MRNVARKREKKQIEPPMTSMIDIIFLLLIFFMLTPSFQGDEAYLTTNLPTNVGPNMGPSNPDIPRIKITLYDEGPEYKDVSIVLNETQSLGTNFDALRSELVRLRNQGLPPDHPVLINPTMAVRHKWVVRAFDTAIAARFTNIQFAVPR